ncbi:MAG TPA: WYL domain-containing protein [Acidimicrobiales bacterium]|nr:WYL domain-containing protein [Acidimicrobiales bacterium]
MDRLERLTNLVLVLLDTDRPLTLFEIVTTVGGYPSGHDAYRQAFERDKRVLRDEGLNIAVEAIDGPDQVGYRIRPEDFYLPDLGLTEEESQALNLAVAAVSIDPAAAEQARWRLARRSPAASVAFLPSLPALPVLHEAVRRRAVVRFRHRDVRRAVEPYGLLFRRGYWYLVGWDLDRKAVRSFRVDRMGDRPDVGPGDEFTPPAGFDLSAALSDEPWLWGEGEEVKATVVVDPPVAARVAREVGEDRVAERRADGSVVLSIPVMNAGAFRSWLMDMLDHAEVTAPADLRADVVSWLRTLADAG